MSDLIPAGTSLNGGRTAINQKITQLDTQLGMILGQPPTEISIPVHITANDMELYGNSTDTKPTTGLTVGTSFFEIDTKAVSMWDGSKWVVL